jgi:hypothetical protein
MRTAVEVVPNLGLKPGCRRSVSVASQPTTGRSSTSPASLEVARSSWEEAHLAMLETG